jgi:hypothetical protein
MSDLDGAAGNDGTIRPRTTPSLLTFGLSNLSLSVGLGVSV